jgi:predicted aminopeptidase
MLHQPPKSPEDLILFIHPGNFYFFTIFRQMNIAISFKLLITKYLFGISALLVAGNYDLVDYGLRMGQGQLKILVGSKKVEKYLNDPAYPDSLKQKLRLIKEIKQFTVDELGFQPSPNYNKLYDQKGKPMMYVVTGSQKYSLTPMVWKFPIVGKVTYKGFFTEEEAKEESARIEKLGFESRIRIVNAWSTLGWFRDPIMSSMLEESPGDIAEVIIHELSHGTIFVKNDVDLSENLANFVGEKGARIFLEKKYGTQSKEYMDYVQNASDYEKFSVHFIRSAKMLDSLYATQTFKNLDSTQKDQVKNSYIQSIVAGIDTISFFHPAYFTSKYKSKLPNNASFIVFRQYNSMQDVLEAEFKKEGEGDLKKYVAFLIRKYNK